VYIDIPWTDNGLLIEVVFHGNHPVFKRPDFWASRGKFQFGYACLRLMAGVMPPMPMFGRSLL
jgi:hypothetical protein